MTITAEVAVPRVDEQRRVAQNLVFGLTAIWVGTGVSWINMQRSACHIGCTPFGTVKISLLYGLLNRGEAYLIPTWLMRGQRLAQGNINQSIKQ